MQIAAALVAILPFNKKKSGTLTSAPLPKQINCLRVSPNRTFDFTAFKSLGTDTYAIGNFLLQVKCWNDFRYFFVLMRVENTFCKRTSFK